MSCGAIFSQWRNWIRPLVITLYVLILLIALPLLIVELNLNNAKTHTQAWLIAGIFVVLAIPISLWGILQHMIHYTQPQLQRHIIRILWMVPIYAMDAWLALRFKDVAIYMDTLRECYEAYVVYNFMAYLLTFLTTQYPNFEAELESKPQVKHIIPFCCLPPWSMGRPLVQYCRHGVLQYTVIRPLTTCIALLCQTQHVYHEGNFNFTSAWSYLAIINNLSQVWAMYCLVLFYLATKEHLAPIKPVAKFMCIKAVVFLTFWQSVLIAALVKVGVIRVDNTMSFYTVEDLATGLQDFIICIEMFFAAIAHYFSFSHIPFVEEDGMQANCFASFTAMWDVSDVRADVVDHVRHVGKTMRKTMRRNQALQTEQSPLLADGGETSYSQTSMPAVTDFPIVGYLGSHGGSIGTINSIDTLTTDMPHSCSFTASMNNYMDLSESIDSHAADQPEYTTPQNEEVSEQLIDLSEDQQSEPISTIEVSSVPVTNSSKPQKGKGKRARGKSARLVDVSSASDILKVDSQIPSRGQIDIAQGCQSAEGQIHSAMRDSKPIGSQGQSSADLGQACESQVQQEDNDAQNIKTVAVKGEYVPSTTTSNSQEPTFI